MALDGIIRPVTVVKTIKKHGETESFSIVKLKGNKVMLQNPNKNSLEDENQYNVTYCYSDDVKNEQLYKDSIMPVVTNYIAGNNVLILAVGQGDSEKDTTITGSIDEPGIVKLFSKSIFDSIDMKYSNCHDYLMTVSYFEVSDTGIKDILNPSENEPKIKSHVKSGIYFKDLSEYCVSSEEELYRFYKEGVQLKSFMIDNEDKSNKLVPSINASTIFRVVLNQKEMHGTSIVSEIMFVTMADSNLAANKRSFTSLTDILSSMRDGNSRNHPSYASSNFTHALQNHLNGNCIPVVIAHISSLDKDYKKTSKILEFLNIVYSSQFKPHSNKCDNEVLIADLRSDINNTREKIVSKGHSMLNKTDTKDLQRLEQLIKDLEYFKSQSWTEKQRVSYAYEKERWRNLASRGLIEVVTNPSRQSNTEIQKKLEILQKDKDKVMFEYKEKRNEVDDLKEKLQALITEYSKLAETGKSGEQQSKSIVPQIHQLKEKLKLENETLKKLKQKLKDIQEDHKQQKEIIDREVHSLYEKSNVKTRLEQERRDKSVKENCVTLANEIERVKIESEQQKSELKEKYSKDHQLPKEELYEMEMKLMELKSEKLVMAVKIKMEQSEKNELSKDIITLKNRYEEDLELQQLQHFQTFRQYREIYEEQKSALDQQYRSLLEESIQDSIYLSSRNEELVEENRIYQQEIAEIKDKITMLESKAS